MRKLVFAFICLFAVFPIKAFSQIGCAETTLYKFTGKIIEKEFDTSGSSILIKTKIEFQITNISDKNVIFWNRDSSETMGENKIVRNIVSKTDAFAEQDIIDTNFGEPSNFYGQSWDELRSSLDKPIPPNDKTITLKPGENWTFQSSVGVVI